MRWLFLLALFTLTISDAAAKSVTVTLGSASFPADEVVSGTTSDAALCSTVPSATWVVVGGKGDCIRYYAGGLSAASNPDVLVFMAGDSLDGNRVESGYKKATPDSLQADAEGWSRKAGGLPYLFLARPGTYGSSGEHAQRRRPREGQLVDAALLAIKERFHVGRYHLAGQSGGGGLVATMLNMRSDIGCAVSASGAVAVYRRAQLLNQARDTTGFTDSYDPVDHVRDIVKSPGLRIFVLSDRSDQTVPFQSQVYYVDELKKAGLTPIQIELNATGATYHTLSQYARPTLIWCAQGVSDAEIETRLKVQSAKAGR